MYDMQITSYDANICFLMEKFTIYLIIQHTKSLSMSFFFYFISKNMYNLAIHDPTYLPRAYVGSRF